MGVEQILDREERFKAIEKAYIFGISIYSICNKYNYSKEKVTTILYYMAKRRKSDFMALLKMRLYNDPCIRKCNATRIIHSLERYFYCNNNKMLSIVEFGNYISRKYIRGLGDQSKKIIIECLNDYYYTLFKDNIIRLQVYEKITIKM